MSYQESVYYTIVCDWPECNVSVDEDSDYSAWSEKSSAYDSLRDASWWESPDGEKHYCNGHTATWASDHEKGEPFPDKPYLLIHDGDSILDDGGGKVTLVEAEGGGRAVTSRSSYPLT